MAGGETENGRKARMAGMQMDRCGILNRMKNGGIHTAPESIVYDSGTVLCTLTVVSPVTFAYFIRVRKISSFA